MKTTFNSIEGKRVRTLEADPQYFGGYLNMAQHNIYSINNHVAEKLGIKPLNDEGNIKNSFLLKNDHGKEFNWNLAYSMTVRFMPVIKVFNFEELPKSIREDLERNKNVPAIVKDFERMRQTLAKAHSTVLLLLHVRCSWLFA